jgi:hypothetical protein
MSFSSMILLCLALALCGCMQSQWKANALERAAKAKLREQARLTKKVKAAEETTARR